MNLIRLFLSTLITGSPQVILSSSHMTYRPGINILFGLIGLNQPIINTILEISCSNNVLPQFDWLPKFNLALRISPCLSAKIPTIRAISQWFRWCESSFNRTISLVWKFLLFFDTLLTLLQGYKEFFAPSIPKFLCYMLHSIGVGWCNKGGIKKIYKTFSISLKETHTFKAY